MEKRYKLFATDMDGTLLNNRKEISDENLRAMKDLYRQGIEVAICTGRPFSTVKQYLKKLDFPCWLISNNGSVLRNTKGDVLSAIYIKQESLLQVINLLEQENIYYHISDTRYNYIQNPFERIEKIRDYMVRTQKSKFRALWYPVYLVFFSNGHKKVNYNSFARNGGKVASIFIVCDSSEKVNRVRKRLMDIGDIDISSSGTNNIEVLDKEATKGHSLKRLTLELNISLREVVAVGDNYNDLTMIQYAGLGVAMENGEEKVKKSADWVTKSNEENGVAYLIYKRVIPFKE